MNRTYNVSHIAMLQSGYEIGTNMEACLSDFTKYNSGITEKYRTNFLNDVESGFTMLGIDNISPINETRQAINAAKDSFSAELIMFRKALGFAFHLDMPYNSIMLSLELDKYTKPYSKASLMAISLNITHSLNNFADEMKTDSLHRNNLHEVVVNGHELQSV